MNKQYIDTIHQYLSGTMVPSERDAFEAEIQRDANLRNAVEIERILLAGIEKSGAQDSKKAIQATHKKLEKEGFFADKDTAEPGSKMFVKYTSKTFTMQKILAVAAALIVLAGAVWFFNTRTVPVDTDTLFVQNYQPENDIQRAKDLRETLQSSGLAGVPTDMDSLKNALELYETGAYAKSLAMLKAFAATHPQSDTAQYYIGVIHMSQERYAKAIEVLLPVSRLDESVFKNDALWNLGLCYLKTENSQQDAYTVFQELADDASFPLHRNAKALKEQLLPEK